MFSLTISELLFSHECVIVPGLGGFLINVHPAKVDTYNHRFYPPAGRVAFNAGLSGNDGLLANHIAARNNITYRQALDEISVWVNELQHTLNEGKPVFLENIGTLHINRHNHLQFEPSQVLNYDENAFGLSIVESNKFRFKSNTGSKAPLQALQQTGRIRYMVAETLKWVAVIAPLAAFSVWGFQNRDVFSTAIQNDAGLFSWSSATPGKTADVPQQSVVAVPDYEYTCLYPGTHASIHEFQPSHQAFSALKQASDASGEHSLSSPEGKDEFYIVVGAFREHSNALNLVGNLVKQGYPAAVVDTSSRGLFIVSIRGLSSRNAAMSELQDIRNNGFEEAWLLRKKS